jgi:hypothetical protein
MFSLFMLPASADQIGDCPDNVDFTEAVEISVIQMRSGFTYSATAIGINGFDPAIWVAGESDQGFCRDNTPEASGYSASLPTTGEVPTSDLSAQVSFSYDGTDPFGNLTLWVTGADGQPGEFVLIVEGMVVTDADGLGDPMSLAINPALLRSGVVPTAYMFSRDGGVDSFVGLIDSEYNWLMDSDEVYMTCDDAGSSCWGDSSEIAGYWVAMSEDYWVEATSTDAMLSIPVSDETEGFFLNFVMRSSGMTTFGEYLAAFHLGTG